MQNRSSSFNALNYIDKEAPSGTECVCCDSPDDIKSVEHLRCMAQWFVILVALKLFELFELVFSWCLFFSSVFVLEWL